MMSLRDRMMETALFAIALFSGGILLHGAARSQGTGGEADGCYNNTCHDIQYYYSCTAGVGLALQLTDCTMCIAPSRCDSGGGTGITCQKGSDMPQGSTVVSVTLICYCANAPANASVEASGSYTGNYTPTGTKQWLCSGSS